MPEKTEPCGNVPRGNGVDPELCSRCGVNSATLNRNRWCADCNSRYQRNYQSGRVQRAERRGYLQGFSEGAGAIQARLWLRFARVPGAMFAGHEIVAMIKSEPAPKAPGN